MVVEKIKGIDCYYDGILKSNLDIIKKEAKKDWDWIFVVDGIEGGGKSTFAQQIAAYCDPSLDIDRICFTPEEFKNAIVKAEKYQAIVYDEAYAGLNSRQAMTQTNRTIVSMLAEIRQKNLFVFIILPTFFDLDKNVAIWRSRGLFHVHVDKAYKRGFFKFYNQTTKKYLYIKGKKFYDYGASAALPNFKGRFTKKYMVDEKEYRQRKLKSLEKYGEDHQVQTQLKDFRKEFVENLGKYKETFNLKQKDIAKLISVADSTIKGYVAEKREEKLLIEKELGHIE